MSLQLQLPDIRQIRQDNLAFHHLHPPFQPSHMLGANAAKATVFKPPLLLCIGVYSV